MEKQTQPPAFMACNNPMADDVRGENREYILHTRSPWLLARVYELHVEDDEQQMELKRKYGAYSTAEQDDIYFVVVPFAWMEEPPEDPGKVSKLLSRMADWWLAYNKYIDDTNYNEDDDR